LRNQEKPDFDPAFSMLEKPVFVIRLFYGDPHPVRKLHTERLISKDFLNQCLKIYDFALDQCGRFAKHLLKTSLTDQKPDHLLRTARLGLRKYDFARKAKVPARANVLQMLILTVTNAASRNIRMNEFQVMDFIVKFGIGLFDPPIRDRRHLSAGDPNNV
jgi:hypothetical protein